jgi:hypothetical protein
VITGRITPIVTPMAILACVESEPEVVALLIALGLGVGVGGGVGVGVGVGVCVVSNRSSRRLACRSAFAARNDGKSLTHQ